MASQNSHHRTYPTLKAWRHAHGLTQIDAAAKLGIEQGSYSKIERGRRVPRRDLLERIARETHVPLESLVGVSL